MLDHIIQSQSQSTEINRVSDFLVNAWKYKNKVKNEYSTPVVNTNKMLFAFNDKDELEARILNLKGEVIKTIPQKDILDMVKQNFIPGIGNYIDIVV